MNTPYLRQVGSDNREGKGLNFDPWLPNSFHCHVKGTNCQIVEYSQFKPCDSTNNSMKGGICCFYQYQ